MAGDRISWARAHRRGWLDTRQVADIIGVTTDIVRGEVSARRLPAEIIPRAPRPDRARAQPQIRIYPEDLRAYLATHYPRVAFVWPAA